MYIPIGTGIGREPPGRNRSALLYGATTVITRIIIIIIAVFGAEEGQ